MFSPFVLLLSSRIGKKRFNQIRGKVIGLHCKTITNFCNFAGIDIKKRQKLIRIAKANGRTLGFI